MSKKNKKIEISENIATKFDEVLGRLKQVVNVKSDTALAKALNLRQSSISTAKSRKQIPPVWLLRVSFEYGISLDWLVYGAGPMRRGEKVMDNKGTNMLKEKQVEYNNSSKADDPLVKAVIQAAQELGITLDMEDKLIAKLLVKKGLKSLAKKALLSIQEMEDKMKKKGQDERAEQPKNAPDKS